MGSNSPWFDTTGCCKNTFTMSELNNKILNATKWSAKTEVMAKLIAPISTMVLARLLTPDAFGVVTTLTMIISFTEIFTDAGFQRYIIQHEFKDDEEKYQVVNVAFWTNLGMSLLFWCVIAIFSDQLATFVGNPGKGIVITIACASIPIHAFSSIQMALYRRSFDFKTLFYTRLVGIFIPIAVTIPLAFWLRNYWALVFGTIALNLSNAIILTAKSKWKPRFYYNIKHLKEMFSFCSLTIVDTILIWATAYIDIFLIGIALNEYYLGIYKTSITTVGQFTSLITTAILPVLMPAFSRLQNDLPQLRATLLKVQKYVAILLLPLGFGIFMFSDLITEVLLGSQWHEASNFIGIWGLMEVLTIIIARFCSNIYPALGKPQFSVITQILHLAVLVPAVYIASKYDFETLYWTRSLVRLQGPFVSVWFVYYLIKLSPWKMATNIIPELFASIVMSAVAAILLHINSSNVLSFLYILICCCVYLGILCIFKNERKVLFTIKNKLLNKKIKH